MSVDSIEMASLDTVTRPQNTAAKRLTEPDVQAVFSCLSSNQPAPKRLAFRIIRVPQNGLKLSPPSFEFDGENFPPLLSIDMTETSYFIHSNPHIPFRTQMVSTYCFGLG